MITSLEELKDAINEIVDYNWSDERRDFEEQVQMGEQDAGKPDHIFATLVKLNNFIKGEEDSPADHLIARENA